MASAAPRNPFAPGPGTRPPVLAGRDAERSLLRSVVDDLHARCAGPVHLLQAPRGMGKTVLLRDLQQTASATVHWLTGADLPDLPCLARELAVPADRLTLDVSGATLGVAGIQRRAPDRSWWRQKVKARLRDRREPRLLVVDEAHVLPADVAHVLLNAAQAFAVSGGAPVALLLAGTPGLRPFLLSDAVNASFVERAPLVVPGLLSPMESREALEAPGWRRWTRDDAVLDEAAADSLGYPWFLQLWGRALWDAGRARRTVDRETLAAARPRVDAVRADFYSHRYDELENAARRDGIPRNAMLAAAQAVAARVDTPGAAIGTSELNRALERAGIAPDDTGVARGIIAGNGFLTRSGDDWRAGIPSLAAYVRRHPR